MPRGLGLVVLAVLGFVLAFGVPAGARTNASSPVDELLARCPTPAEIASVDAKIQITIEGDPTAGTDVCGMTALRANAYRTLLVMQHLQFARPLPWTNLSLWDWFGSAITGIRLRNDIGTSFCCQPANTVDIQTQNLTVVHAGATPHWIDPSTGSGLAGLLSVLVHEARHNEHKLHTCANNIDDQTWNEQGAWAVESEVELWQGLYNADAFLDAPDPAWSDQYRNSGLGTYTSRICGLASADVGAATTVVPAAPLAGSRITVTTTLANNGPGTADDVFVYDPVPAGTSLVAAAASQGSCLAVTPVRVACELGALAAGATAQVSLQLDVTAPAGTTITAGGKFHQNFGPYAIAIAKDDQFRNNEAPWALTVATPTTTTAAPPTTAPPPATTEPPAATTQPPPAVTTPKPAPRKKELSKCKRGHRSTKKHPCRR